MDDDDSLWNKGHVGFSVSRTSGSTFEILIVDRVVRVRDNTHA